MLLALASLSLLLAPIDIGAVAPAITLIDTHYLPRHLEDLGSRRAFVLVFVTRQCPIAQRYLPRVAALEKEYRAQDVQFALVNVGADDSIRQVAQDVVERELELPALKDFDGAAATALGVTRTPEVVVLDGERRLRYRGRVDAQYRLGGVNPEAGREDLREALDDVLAGRDVRTPETAVDGCLITPEHLPESPGLTWSDEVAAIVHAQCTECHRPGGAAPFALRTYDEVANRIDMVREVVRQRRMPPWYASDDYGHFRNRRGLTDAERRTLLAWAAEGAPSGDLSRAPEPPPPPSGAWRIDPPDLVITQLGTTTLPADGVVPYQYVVLPWVFLHDTWVQQVEIRAENRRALHHANLAFFKLGEKFRTENFITGLVPGGDPMQLDEGVAALIPAGSVLGLQAHYVTTGAVEQDRLSVGLRFPRVTVEKRLRDAQIADLRFTIPPFSPAHPVRGTTTFVQAATGVGLFVHMHVRGRDMTFTATSPGGERETLLLVPNYNFEWQSSYRWPADTKRFAAGTRIDVLAHFDNSAFNPYNPDPTKPVHFGLQTEQEMMYGFFFYTFDDERLGVRVDPASGQRID
jgi:hypothetical protein